MGEWRAEDPAASYPGPPPAGPYPPPSYGPPGSIPPGGSWPYPPGYPVYPPAYGYGVMSVPPEEQRPGTLTASAILGYVLSGFLVIAGFVVSFGASAVNSLEDLMNNDSGYDFEFVLAGVANLVAAGLLIAGGVLMINRNSTGRILFTVGNGIEIVAAIYWIARWVTRDGFEYLLIWALLFTALAIVGLSLAFTGADNRWLARRSPSSG